MCTQFRQYLSVMEEGIHRGRRKKGEGIASSFGKYFEDRVRGRGERKISLSSSSVVAACLHIKKTLFGLSKGSPK